MLYNKPLVTVIIVCYNHEKYINKCIESIIKQTYKNIEIIAFDNGSDDKSAKILSKLSQKYNFIFKSQQNIGLSKTLNLAIKNYAHGKYISPISGDDYFMLDKIEDQVEIMENEKDDVAVCSGNIILVDEFDKPFPKQYMNRDFVLDDFNKSFLEGNPICAPTVLVRKSVYDKVGYYDSSLSIEDYDIWLRILYNGYTIKNVNKIYAYYRQHSNNISLNTEIINKDEEKIFLKYRKHLLYKTALKHYNLRKFLVYAKINKIKAICLMPKIIMLFKEKIFIRGIIYLFIPKFVLKKFAKYDQRIKKS